MVRQCFKCKKLDFLNPSLTFHKFPNEPDRRKIWLKNLKLENKTTPKTSVICSDHFDEEDLIFNASGSCSVKDNAFPKLKSVEDPEVKDQQINSSHDECLNSFVKFENFEVKAEINTDIPERIMDLQIEEDRKVFENCSIKTEIMDCIEEEERWYESMYHLDQPDLIQIKIEKTEIAEENMEDDVTFKNEEIFFKDEEYEEEELVAPESPEPSTSSSVNVDKREKDNEEKNQSLLIQFKKNKCREYRCLRCTFITNDNRELIKHTIQEHSNKAHVYKNIHTAYIPDLEKQEMVGGTCHICDFKTDKMSNLKEHYRDKHFQVYQCNDCGFWTVNRSNFTAHRRKHETSNCDKCEFKTNKIENLKKHYRHKHFGEVNVYQCSDCGYWSTNSNIMTTHHSKYNNSKVELKCHKCKFKTAKKHDLIEHCLRQHSKGVKVYECGQCVFQTACIDCLKKHHYRHIRKRNDGAECRICGFFKNVKKIDLVEHSFLQHSKVFNVHQCNKSHYYSIYKSIFERRCRHVHKSRRREEL